MNITKVWMPETNDVQVTCEGWKSEGEFHGGDGELVAIEQIPEIAAHCHNSSIELDEKGQYQVTGDYAETALSIGKKVGIVRTDRGKVYSEEAEDSEIPSKSR